MNIALIYHKDPYSPNPRGGELSVRAICEYLSAKGHHIAMSNGPSREVIQAADVVMTWGRPALRTAIVCRDEKKPMLLMVRFWKNICTLPAGDLMTRHIDFNFTTQNRVTFETAAAIVTNTQYARQVIERWQPSSRGKVHVSYVPILGEFKQTGNSNGKITIITPEIYGENWLVEGLAKQLPDERFLVVNADLNRFKNLSRLGNVEVCGYMDMNEVWKQTKILLMPIYGNDICGTRRVTIEATRHGIPVIASDASGMSEKIPQSLLINQDAGIDSWVNRILAINADYKRHQADAKETWERYNTPAQLEQFEKILTGCLKK